MPRRETTPLIEIREGSYIKDRIISSARQLNRAVTTTGMFSLGLLAALITHHTLEDKEWPIEAIIALDAISLVTAVAGKAAIILFFNEEPFIKGLEKICSKKLPDHFKLSKKTLTEKFQWIINLTLSINVSLFWSGLVQVSFEKSGDLFKKFNTKATSLIGSQLQKPYVYFFFVVSSAYANMLAWPAIHTSAYQQKRNLLGWFWKQPWKSNRDDKKFNEEKFRVEKINNKVLHEIKKIIEGVEKSPFIDKLFSQLPEIDVEGGENTENIENTNNFKQQTINKLNRILKLKPNELRALYLKNSDKSQSPLSNKKKTIKYTLSLGITALAVYGYRNVIGLCDDVWKNWNAENVSKYFSSYLSYYSTAEVILQSVYPLICNLFDMVAQGIAPYVFSRKKLLFVIAMVFFVGSFGGLSNSEQSYLDGEKIFDIVNADLASFLVDAFGIYMIFKVAFESRIKEDKNVDLKTTLKKIFLQLQELGQEAANLKTKIKQVEPLIIQKDDHDENSEEGKEVSEDKKEEKNRGCSCSII